jgi:serine/threonine protein kinase
VTTRYVDLQPVGMGESSIVLSTIYPSNLHNTGAFGLVWYVSLGSPCQVSNLLFGSHSSAKDQLSGTSVAIKKIMKPFSTPVLAKRTYRELKLLKHIQHENVGIILPLTWEVLMVTPQIISLSDVFISPLEDL